MDSLVGQLLVLLATSVWWAPLLRAVALAVWEVAAPPERPRSASSSAPALRTAPVRTGSPWRATESSGAHGANAAWATGRRRPAQRLDAFPEREAGSGFPTAFRRARRAGR